MCFSSRRGARGRAAVAKGAASGGTVPAVSASSRLLSNSEEVAAPVTKESAETRGQSPELLSSLTFCEGNSELCLQGATAETRPVTLVFA